MAQAKKEEPKDKKEKGKKKEAAPKKSILDTIMPSWLKPKNQVTFRLDFCFRLQVTFHF